MRPFGWLEYRLPLVGSRHIAEFASIASIAGFSAVS
jgi:hypothetical protein